MAELSPQPSVAIFSRWLGENPKRNNGDYEDDLKVTALLDLRTRSLACCGLCFPAPGQS